MEACAICHVLCPVPWPINARTSNIYGIFSVSARALLQIGAHPFMTGAWRGGRVVEGARLESVYTGNRIAGSNPALSASLRIARYSARQRPITADNRTSFCGA